MDVPIETVYDSGRAKWVDAINLGKIEIRVIAKELSAGSISIGPKEFKMHTSRRVLLPKQ